ncbi:MAG: aminoacyl-tRNA hydrolase [Desulfoprunum sp.]|nr:aminoacyl-tRNA hydrolase [Desulfoprunum sp.]
MGESDYLIVGLGNPGDSYEKTRHNVGFIIVDELARRWDCSLTTEKWQALSGRVSIGCCRICFVKPTTFMNLSGRAVALYAEYFKISPDRLLIIHDDIDMPPGRLKLVTGGGAGGHNGIRSLIQSLGTQDFRRLKIGVGRPGKGDIHPDTPVEKYVLSQLSKDERMLLDERMDILEQGIKYLLEEQPVKAMNLINAVK